jgi:DNA polymerase-3 subunit alpha
MYDLPEMEEFLKDTYGITVYQEQVMLLSQKLAGFTKGEADVLRKAMGKKDRATLDKMKSRFIEGTKKNNLDPKVCEKVWTDWEAFAQYAFNKSHSTCYAFVAFQTAYLKSHYPAEYMSAVLTHNLGNIDKITFFMEECRRMNLPVLGPDVNESQYNFAVNDRGEIRFGLGAVKGVGEGAVLAIIEERNRSGMFPNIFDLAQRVSTKAVNKRCLESMAMAGAFDCWEGVHRAQYFAGDSKDPMPGIERVTRFASAFSVNTSSMTNTLFGEDHHETITVPALPITAPWNSLEKLRKEKEVIGFYISGHPLDEYKFEIDNFCTHRIDELKEVEKLKDKDISIAGILTEVNHRMSKNGKPFGSFTIEDFSGSTQLVLFGADYGKLKEFLIQESFVYIRAKVQTRFNQADNWEVKPYSIQFLSDVSDKMAKSLTLKVAIEKVNDEFINAANEILAAHPGNATVKFCIEDSSENMTVELPSKKLKVKASQALLDEISALKLLDIKVN